MPGRGTQGIKFIGLGDDVTAGAVFIATDDGGVRGRGILFHDGKRDQFEAGDFLFVAAATEHRIEDFSDDLLVWRVFYGAKGGEVPA